MPVSNPHHIPTVLHFVTALEPTRVLDVGVGSGAYGFLVRQYLDIAEGRVQPATWTHRIEGVEVFAPYRNPVWDYAYDAVHVGDVRMLLPDLGRYDLILFNDVLEHFQREEARALVRLGLAHAPVVVATTPNRNYPQGAWGGNEAETHHALLDASDFDGLVTTKRTGITSCYVCANTPDARARVREAALACPVGGPTLVGRMRRRLARVRR